MSYNKANDAALRMWITEASFVLNTPSFQRPPVNLAAWNSERPLLWASYTAQNSAMESEFVGQGGIVRRIVSMV